MFKLVYIYLFTALSSCGNLGNNRSASDNEAVYDTLTYHYQDFRDNSPYLVGEENNIDTSYYAIRYPVFKDDLINETIRPYFLLDGDSTVHHAAESFIAGFNEFVEDSNPQLISYPWYKQVESSIWSNTPIFITMATVVDEYTGGAHGNHYTILSNIDIVEKRRVEIKDLFNKEHIPSLTKIAEHLFRKQEHLSEKESLEDNFFFENGNFAINDNFGFTKSNLVFYYNEYEIRPYAEGPTLLEIPYSEIEDILNPRGKMYLQSIRQALDKS